MIGMGWGELRVLSLRDTEMFRNDPQKVAFPFLDGSDNNVL